MLKTAIHGFCMALADSVPGVSGGTIAFIMGFYDNFIGAIHDITFGGFQKKKDAFFYLAKLGVGWGIGMVLAILALAAIFESQIYMISSAFIGFILCAIPLILQDEKKTLKGQSKSSIFLVIGLLLVVAISYFNTGSNGIGTDLTTLTFGKGIYLFVVGMIAISAMFLPGISGSTLLLIFGLYIPIVTAVKEILHLNFNYFFSVFVFGCGVITGAATVVKGIKICLDRFRPQTVYAIIGMMLGSIYPIIMGPTTLEIPQPAMSLSHFNVIAFILGGCLIYGLQMGRAKKERMEEVRYITRN